MGLQINEFGHKAAFRPSLQRPTREGDTGPSRAHRADEPSLPFQRTEEPAERLGFGQDSVSIPRIAIRTIDRNLRAAGELVPSVEELQVAAEERRAQQELEAREETRPAAPRFDVRVGLAQAVENTRTFVNSINEGASGARERSTGVPVERPGRLNVQVGGNSFGLQRPADAPTIDFLA
jgi:hypothetical protein